ncbi:nuclease-related domain-containing protein [Rossellomorea aquimaris]|uniref:NERD domain-containing protein n=1 Tax=Rossellomorea aquimaris TaxID=189382 RepID=A0A5D4TRI6_9BACI|nr:nuclease-related domain-containing protein [Rossellomorea aquimaris]TYS76686.1 NERD domain-containing protein [Rossellomorea aquimaris]TYS83592.1 NERD domain-containing protein [Rossellomorea aquimaris]
MIEKERIIPRIILILQALLRRLPLNHPKLHMITEELGKRMAGFKGETALDYSLSFLDPKKYFILHDLRIPHKESFFQMDTLLFTSKFILIIEVKYLAGTAYFDPVFNQLIQIKDGNEQALPDPTLQIKRQESQLISWLSKHGFPNLPIYSCVVMSNDRTIIKTSPANKSLNKIVIHRHSLLNKVKYIEDSMRKETATPKDVKKIIRTLKRKHEESKPSILERFNIEDKDLLKGVICVACNHRPLVRKHGTWFCLKCDSRNNDAHIQALKDYELLIAPTINNSELREYLVVDSPYVAKRLLQSLNLPTTGTKKGTQYILSSDESPARKHKQKNPPTI